ncbi:hypothetical protein OOZ25_06840 [Bacillus subtilis]|uniref:hypothetical protein n=1 Tax=Bacillus subtilis TaxID=1423 RepID=UPI002555FC5E|nr:hypothetical protein [Bacillus subtilis]MDL2029020.1 hypothetical protein [Bacillus subtilis]
MDIQNVQSAAVKAINSIRNRGLEVEVIQFRGDIWEALTQDNENIGNYINGYRYEIEDCFAEPQKAGGRDTFQYEFAGCRAEKKELLRLCAFQIIVVGAYKGGKGGIREIDIIEGTDDLYTVVTPKGEVN